MMRWGLLALAAAQMRSVKTCSGAGPPTYEEVTNLLLDAAMPCQFATNHAVMLVPRSAGFKTGEAAMSAKAYARLPRKTVDMNAKFYTGYEVAFDKVVLIGVDPAASEGVYIADCGTMTDSTATSWLREKAGVITNGASVLDSASTAGVDAQAPFIDIVMPPAGADESQANVVTLIMGKQSNQLGQQVGDLLYSLVHGDGIWVKKSVLFVFAADLSKNLDKEWARDRDGTTLEEVTGGSFNTMLTYVEQLQQASEGDQARAPVDFAGVLGAMKLAQNLQLRGKVIMHGNSADYIGDPATNQNDLVQGYGSVIFSKSTLSESQEASAKCPEPELPPETTTTTEAPTTPQVPTMEPAPFGATPPVLLKLKRSVAAAPAPVNSAAHYQGRFGRVVDELASRAQTSPLALEKAAALLSAK
jgi:AmmeMemoRadiSam system protein B